MTSQETTTYLARSLRLQHLVRVALLALFLGQLLTGRVCGAEDAADPYDTLYDVIMTRYGPDGKSYAENETSPIIFADSDFPFGDKTYKKFNAALDVFAALLQAKIEAYSDVKRALLQSHLWKVFDATTPVSWKFRGKTHRLSHSDRRVAVRPKIGSLLFRIARLRGGAILVFEQTSRLVKTAPDTPDQRPREISQRFPSA